MACLRVGPVVRRMVVGSAELISMLACWHLAFCRAHDGTLGIPDREDFELSSRSRPHIAYSAPPSHGPMTGYEMPAS